jgi:hypothetical protein
VPEFPALLPVAALKQRELLKLELLKQTNLKYSGFSVFNDFTSSLHS